MTDGHADQHQASEPAGSAPVVITVRIRVCWWLRWYLGGVAFTSRLTGLPPDFGQVAKWIRRGIGFHLEPRRPA